MAFGGRDSGEPNVERRTLNFEVGWKENGRGRRREDVEHRPPRADPPLAESEDREILRLRPWLW